MTTRYFGKLAKGNKIIYAPTPIEILGRKVYTNDPESYRQLGYYPIEYIDYPTDGNLYIQTFAQEGDKIIAGWKEDKSPKPETVEEQIKKLAEAQTEAELALAEIYEAIINLSK